MLRPMLQLGEHGTLGAAHQELWSVVRDEIRALSSEAFDRCTRRHAARNAVAG